MSEKVLVLITGTGRSGTSTMAGTFHHLGLHVPAPYLIPNESNPSGFFETKWSVFFHKRLLRSARVHEFDSRPTAFDDVQRRLAESEELRSRIPFFLGNDLPGHDQVVIKDPRSVWLQDHWRESAAGYGYDIKFLSMLRHPAEVVGSRATYYAGETDDDAHRRLYTTFTIGRWINGTLLNERETRGHARAFVRYVDLLEDWRPVLIRLRDQFGLRYDDPLTDATPSPVDDFIQPDLRRHQTTWDDLDIPDSLRELAQETWEAVDVLADQEGVDAGASARLDELTARYRRMYDDASAIAHDLLEDAYDRGRRAAHRDEAKARAQDPEARRIGELGGRELLAVAARRLRGRLRGGRDRRDADES